MNKTIKYVSLDVHKDSITIAIADEGREGEVQIYGEILNNFRYIDKIMRTFFDKTAS